MMARFCGILIHSPPSTKRALKYIKKKRCQSQNFLDPRLQKERERERESEPAHGAHETFSHNLTFYVNQYCTNS